ncbi:hypothetical protein EF917_24045 [Streptomyces sp. WAC00469]|nr:hypothetical protein EF917_24045 [Streptomyces sp. WAC00469]
MRTPPVVRARTVWWYVRRPSGRTRAGTSGRTCAGTSGRTCAGTSGRTCADRLVVVHGSLVMRMLEASGRTGVDPVVSHARPPRPRGDGAAYPLFIRA